MADVIVDPPRAVPHALQLLVLTRSGIGGTWLAIPAAFFLVLSVLVPAPAARVVFMIIGSLFLSGAAKAIVDAFRRSEIALRLMRGGFLNVGRVVCCRFAWDSGSHDKPYADFLSDWKVNLVKSQLAKSAGCIAKAIAILFALVSAPFVIAFAYIAVMGLIGAADYDDETMRFATPVLGWLIISFLVGMLVKRRGSHASVVAPFAKPTEIGDEADGEIPLPAPLPAQGLSKMELVCEIVYPTGGKGCRAQARLPFCNRLDLRGRELLLFHPSRPGEIVPIVTLPSQARIGADGQWQNVRPGWWMVMLASAGCATSACVISLGMQFRWILYLLR